jgi:S1-C subfamily serine protease
MIGAGGVTRFKETGSGVLISDSGRVMTAAHVVNGMDEITVEGIGGEVVSATIISANAAADVSLLQLERVTAAMRVAPLGDSDTVGVGQQVMVVGAPYGLAYSMSVGWISARWPPNTIFPDMPLAEFLQTTATINTGNSGGPIFNMAGEVIGIVSQNISKSGGSEGLALSCRSTARKKLLVEGKVFWGALQGMLLTGDLAGDLQRPCARRVPRQDGRPGFDGVEDGPARGQQDRHHRREGDCHWRRHHPLGRGHPRGVRGQHRADPQQVGRVPRGTPFKMSVLRAGKILVLTGTTQGASR